MRQRSQEAGDTQRLAHQINLAKHKLEQVKTKAAKDRCVLTLQASRMCSKSDLTFMTDFLAYLPYTALALTGWRRCALITLADHIKWAGCSHLFCIRVRTHYDDLLL